MSRTRAFTLIELLVVISIISVLIGILLPSLATARERARLIRWKGYSNNLRTDTLIAAYYNFEEQTGDEKDRNGEPVLYNRAAGDPFEQAKGAQSKSGATEPNLRNAILRANTTNLPKWDFKQGRFQGKGSLKFLGTADRTRCEVPKFRGQVQTDERTVAAWVRTEITNLSHGIASWGYDSTTSNPHYRLALSTNGGGTVEIDAGNNTRAYSKDLRNKKWHFVCARLSKPYTQGSGANLDQPVTGDIEVFADFQKSGRTSSNNAIYTGDDDFVIGASSDPTGSSGINLQGWIDELMIFKSGLTDDQIKEMVTVGSPRDFEPIP